MKLQLVFGLGSERIVHSCGEAPRKKQNSTCPPSTRFVIMTMTCVCCSHTIRQNLPKLVGIGPCVAMYAFARSVPST